MAEHYVGVNSGGKLFNTGKGSIDSISNVAYVRRVRLPVNSESVTIPATSNTQPLVNNNLVAMSNADIIRNAIRQST